MENDIDLGELLINAMSGNSGETLVRVEGPYGVRLDGGVDLEAAAVSLIYAARAQHPDNFDEWFAQKRQDVINRQMRRGYFR